MSEKTPSVQRLMNDLKWALAHELPSSELVPMLNKLLRHAEPESQPALFAKRKLAELLVQEDPWRSALLARQLLAVDPDARTCARTWGLLGLAQTLLGNYRCAARAYRQAMALSPDFPMCAHNLGHLLDVALNRPYDALRYLEQAYRALPDEPEVGSSYAHALARTGHHERAKAILARALDGDAHAAEGLLCEWLQNSLQEGAPAAAVSERVSTLGR